MTFRLLAAVLVLASASNAQIVLANSAYAFSGPLGKNVVRDATGRLWQLSVVDDGAGNRPLVLQSSTDGGQTWSSAPFTFNDAASGLNPPNPTTVCSLAIDSTGLLHAVWGRYYYPTYYQQFYRNFDPATATASAILNLTATFAGGTGVAADACAIVVDAADTVWIAAQTASSWISQLLRSTSPSAAGLAFASVGNISPTASSQGTELTVDAQGFIHCAFYRNVAPGNYEHRRYDPVTSTWDATTTVLGNTTPTNDYWGKLAADGLGNVHALFVKDAHTTTTWQFRYRRWDATNGFGSEVTLFDATTTQYTGIANYQIISLACDETTGKVYTVYRDLGAGGPLRLAEKGLVDPAFTTLGDLQPASAALNVYHAPSLRGALFPSFNNTGAVLDVTWQSRPASTPPWSMMFQRFDFGTPLVTLSLGGPPIVGTITTLELASPADPNAAYLAGLSLGTSPGTPLGDGRTVPLNYDALLAYTITPGNAILVNSAGFLTPSGQASLPLVIPNLPVLLGATLYAGFVVGDPTNPTGVGTISPSLPITFQ